MSKFDQNVKSGHQGDPPSTFESIWSKNKKVTKSAHFDPILGYFDPKSGFKIAKMSKLDLNIKSGHVCNTPSKFELIRSKNKKVIQGKKEKRAPPKILHLLLYLRHTHSNRVVAMLTTLKYGRR